MAKVYIVYDRYYEAEDYTNGYAEENIVKVFDSEDKAIDYIYERIKSDHEKIDAAHSEDKHVHKCDLDDLRIMDTFATDSWWRIGYGNCISQSYRYETYELE